MLCVQSLSESGLTALLEMACEGRMWSRALQLVTMEGVDVTPQQHRLAMQVHSHTAHIIPYACRRPHTARPRPPSLLALTLAHGLFVCC